MTRHAVVGTARERARSLRSGLKTFVATKSLECTGNVLRLQAQLFGTAQRKDKGIAHVMRCTYAEAETYMTTLTQHSDPLVETSARS